MLYEAVIGLQLNTYTKIFCLFSWTLVAILLTGCGQSPASTPTPSPKPTNSATPTLTLTPLPTHTPSPSSTPTAFPRLPVEQARARLLELLATNGNCRLPCLWGITPGKTTHQEARAILEELSNISGIIDGLNVSPSNISPFYAEGDLTLYTELAYLYPDYGVIRYIYFKIWEYKKWEQSNGLGGTDFGLSPVFDSKIFGGRVRPYMLPGILSNLGKPGSVVIRTYGKQVGIGGFEIVLVYPDQGIFVHYTMQMKTVGANVRGCPANAQVELFLYPSGNADLFAKSLSKDTYWGGFARKGPIEDNPYSKSIEGATSMTLEQFYETFRLPTDKCIETPLKGWYVPEQ